MTGLLNPKSSGEKEITAHFFFMLLVVYLGHGIFRPGLAVVFFLQQINFCLRKVLSSQIEG